MHNSSGRAQSFQLYRRTVRRQKADSLEPAAAPPGGTAGSRTEKRPFDIDEMLRRIEEAVRPYPKAALFELADDGYTSVFHQLIACLLSIRTRDEAMAVMARRLFERAPTPAAIVAMPYEELDDLIRQSSFHEAKARQIQTIARATVEQYGGELPCDFDVLTSFAGVGPKCANLALGIACGQARIGVDVHVHRVTNRWGYVQTRSPEQTMEALEQKLPKQYWVTINRLLVPFGKHICTGVAPRCSTCPVLEFCRQVGVTSRR
jgi:endonuclease-3